jgi:KipI family sensor histidine kinase inhibitor
MGMVADEAKLTPPVIQPLGDTAVLVKFSARLSDAANQRAIAFASRLDADMPEGVTEIDPNLVSVLVRFDPARVEPARLAGELRLRLCGLEPALDPGRAHELDVRYGGEYGPDLEEVAALLQLAPHAFVARHKEAPLRVLTTGFAPGFVYCGFHAPELVLPRRRSVRPHVPPGSLLFAAGQTAITSTSIRTGWHVIGRTTFRNFDAGLHPPTILREGDSISFRAA